MGLPRGQLVLDTYCSLAETSNFQLLKQEQMNPGLKGLEVAPELCCRQAEFWSLQASQSDI